MCSCVAQEPVCIFECVPQQGLDEYVRCIGSHYVLQRATISPHTQGWAIRRPRQYIVGYLRGLDVSVPRSPVARRWQLQAMLDTCFTRTCAYGHLEYCVSTPDELSADKSWARSRCDVVSRHSSGDDPYGDDPHSWEYALTSTERSRLESFLASAPGRSIDLGQSAQKPVHSPTTGPLHTLRKGMGLTWLPPLRRWMTPLEQYVAMGFPVTQESIIAYRGVDCMFARGFAGSSPRRSRNSMCMQLGNAMHVNSMGSVVFCAVWQNSWLRAAILPDASRAIVFPSAILRPSTPGELSRDDSYDYIAKATSAKRVRKTIRKE